jgi:uncharacterized protein YbjT (DUF2867 family)
MRVLVTGATGKIGRLIVRHLLKKGIASFSVRALVRDKQSEEALRRFLGPLAAGLEVLNGDIREPDTLAYAFRGVDAVVIATGPTAKVDMGSLIGETALSAVSFGYSSAKPHYWFEAQAGPQQVDWEGQRNQVDAAKAADARHVVLLSTMGGTRPDHFLNENMADIALWKRKAEHYLVASGVPYTIIRAGGLFGGAPDQVRPPAITGSKQPLGVTVDDDAPDGTWEGATVPPEDLAAICTQCLEEKESQGKSFDIWSGVELPASSVSVPDVKELLAKLNGRNGSYKETPHEPGMYRRKGLLDKLAEPPNCAAVPATCGGCASECKDGRRFENRKDVKDAEAPGMKLYYMDEKITFNEKREKFQRPKNTSTEDDPNKLKGPYRFDDHWEPH